MSDEIGTQRFPGLRNDNDANTNKRRFHYIRKYYEHQKLTLSFSDHEDKELVFDFFFLIFLSKNKSETESGDFDPSLDLAFLLCLNSSSLMYAFTICCIFWSNATVCPRVSDLFVSQTNFWILPPSSKWTYSHWGYVDGWVACYTEKSCSFSEYTLSGFDWHRYLCRFIDQGVVKKVSSDDSVHCQLLSPVK